MNKNPKNILNKIVMIKETLPKKQKQLCNYIVENYNSIGMLTMAELAKEASVGTTTIVRTMKVLGYESFSDMRKELYEMTMENSLPTWWHMQKSFIPKEESKENSILETWPEIVHLLDSTLNNSLVNNFRQAINLLLEAKRINILGLRASKGAAIYFAHLIEEFYPVTNQLSNDSEFIFDRIFQFNKGDVLFLIAHSPYTAQSIKAAKFCYERDYPIILVTDLLSCPITPYATIILKVESSNKQYSITPTIALLESIVIEIGRQTSSTSVKNLENLGNILKDKDVTR